MAIIVGYVPTPEGRAALEFAIEEARRRGSRLVVLNTSTGAALVDKRYSGSDDWATIQQQLRDSGVEFEVNQTVQTKDPSEAILAAAEQTNAELIVIGLRRRTPVGKLIMGSQAQRILLDAECPVVGVKGHR